MLFWKSVVEGFVVLGRWQVWMALFLHLAVSFGYLLIVARRIGKSEAAGMMPSFPFCYMIGGIVLQGVLIGLLVTFLLPILLGGSSVTPLSAIASLLWPIIKAGLAAIAVVIGLSLVPLIGRLVADSMGIQVFLEAAIIFRIFSAYDVHQILAEADVTGSVYPGFWACIGFLVIVGSLVRLAAIASALPLILLEDTAAGELLGELLMPLVFGGVLAILGGLIPLFMYSAYVRLSIVELIGG